jgi:uncharacterized protein involved in outer membrane biogenesis
MANTRLMRWALIALAALVLFAAAAFAGLHFATKALKSQIEQALGPESEVGEIVVGWSAIEIRGLRIRAPKGWPAEDALRAQRIVVAPDLRALLAAQPRVHRITVEQGYISLLRARDGRLRVVPSLMEKKPAAGAGGAPAPSVAIGAVELRDSVVEFFDATVRQPAHRLRLEQLQAVIDDLRVPELAGRTRLKLEATVKGVQRNGTLSLAGWAELTTRDSEITTRMRGVDLVAFQPYLIKAAEAGVRRGTLDLDLNSVVRKNALRAPGTLTLSGLELAQGGGTLGTFMGMPRQAVLAALRDKKGQIRLSFTLEGRLDDPQFSLNESFATRVGAGIADTLGVSIEGLARGAAGAARGVGDTLRGLFGK